MKTLTTTFFSTLDSEQTWDCAKNLFFPWKWSHFKSGKYIKEGEDVLKNYLGTNYCLSFYNGRTALFYALKAAGIKEQDEVIVQAYTCVSVPRTVLYAGAKVVYCDVDESLNLDPEKLRGKITAKTKVVIIQHTFGNPARIDEIKKICAAKADEDHTDSTQQENSVGNGRNKIFLIEDCAHSLGARYKGKLLGTFGDISIFSSGRDKVISSVNGGMLCTDNEQLFKNINDAYSRLPFPSFFLIARNLLYPIVAISALKCYNKFSLGKGMMYFSKKLKLIPLILTKGEKGIGENTCWEMSLHFRMPNVLACLFLRQFTKLGKYNEHRKKISRYYMENLADKKTPRIWEGSEPVFLRHTLLDKNAADMIAGAKKKDIYMGNWYRNNIDPKGVNFEKIGYEQNMCPKAEAYAAMSVNLPNHFGIEKKDAERVCNVIRNCFKI